MLMWVDAGRKGGPTGGGGELCCWCGWMRVDAGSRWVGARGGAAGGSGGRGGGGSWRSHLTEDSLRVMGMEPLVGMQEPVLGPAYFTVLQPHARRSVSTRAPVK